MHHINFIQPSSSCKRKAMFAKTIATCFQKKKTSPMGINKPYKDELLCVADDLIFDFRKDESSKLNEDRNEYVFP